MDILLTLAKELKINQKYAENIVALIDDGNTIPFIARYRKEMTGSCDDQTLREFADRLTYLRNLEKRKAEVISSIESQGKLTPELESAVSAAATLAEVEDLYRPYKQKRRTRATIARERGLEPLAELIIKQDIFKGDIESLCLPYIDGEKGVNSWEEALNGAKDIIAEDISDDAALRKSLKELIWREGVLRSKALVSEPSVYDMYYDYAEPVKKVPSHRVLAINRGEKEEVLRAGVEINEGAAMQLVNKAYLREGSVTSPAVAEAATDSFKRLIFPSVEREIRASLTENASEQAIHMFALNLKPLLLQPPVRDKVTLALDPAYRTGCKVAVVDGTGKVLDTTVVYPTPPQNKTEEATKILTKLIEKHGVEVISIGNGTASKETEIFAAGLIKTLSRPVAYMVVNESGASVYSASKLGAEEFPEYDVSLRSAISIARRLQDPLAELVKIDPKSIGVGQYQHDMPPARLDESLAGVVEYCVNTVGVDLNTASAPLLSRISGLSSAVAKNIVAYREANGRFRSRRQLTKVSKLGPKAFEQCAGFLRIPGGENLLDNTSVHPEAYSAAERLLKLFNYTVEDAAKGGLSELRERIMKKGEATVAEACGVGVPTLSDIVAELLRPGRDPRDELPAPNLRTDVMDMNDLKPGMELTGTVRNVIDFGVFVDIGVHQDGLVHISQVASRYIKHPSEVVKVGDMVTVYVLSVDVPKKRISLTMLKPKT